MTGKLANRNLPRLMLLLASPVLLTGCAKTQPYALIARDSLCRSWQHQTISKDDKLTEKTASGIEGNNKARPEWGCEYGKNQGSES